MSVVNVGEPSSGNLSLLNIRKLIQEISPMYAVSVGKVLPGSYCLLHMSELIYIRNPIDIVNIE